MTLYEYSTNETSKIVVVREGRPDEPGTEILEGTCSTTILGLRGELISRVVVDIPSQATLSQELYSDFDDQARPGRVDYLMVRTKRWCMTVPPTQSVALFLNDRGSRLTRFGVRLILKKHVQKAAQQHPSLKHKRLHPHSVRHSTAVHLLRAGVDLSTIAHWLGHVSVNTTNKYLAIDLDAKREALAKAKPLLKGVRRSGKWQKDRDLIAWLEAL